MPYTKYTVESDAFDSHHVIEDASRRVAQCESRFDALRIADGLNAARRPDPDTIRLQATTLLHEAQREGLATFRTLSEHGSRLDKAEIGQALDTQTLLNVISDLVRLHAKLVEAEHLGLLAIRVEAGLG